MIGRPLAGVASLLHSRANESPPSTTPKNVVLTVVNCSWYFCQNCSRYYRKSKERWQELARTADAAFVFADFDHHRHLSRRA